VNLGAPELLILLLIGVVFVLPVYGIVRAAKANETGWLIAILIGWFLALGWLVSLVYLLGPDREHRRAPGGRRRVRRPVGRGRAGRRRATVLAPRA